MSSDTDEELSACARHLADDPIEGDMRTNIHQHMFLPAAALATLLAPEVASAGCRRLTRPLANRISAALSHQAPDWAKPLLSPVQLMRFDGGSLHDLTFFLGYSALNLERLGVNGAPPFNATVVIRCRDNRVDVVTDPYVWANTHARELHLSIANAEQAAGFAAEVVSLGIGRRPDSADASRQGPVFRVRVVMSPRQGSTPAAGGPDRIDIEVDRTAFVRRL